MRHSAGGGRHLCLSYRTPFSYKISMGDIFIKERSLSSSIRLLFYVKALGCFCFLLGFVYDTRRCCWNERKRDRLDVRTVYIAYIRQGAPVGISRTCAVHFSQRADGQQKERPENSPAGKSDDDQKQIRFLGNLVWRIKNDISLSLSLSCCCCLVLLKRVCYSPSIEEKRGKKPTFSPVVAQSLSSFQEASSRIEFCVVIAKPPTRLTRFYKSTIILINSQSIIIEKTGLVQLNRKVSFSSIL